MAVTIFIVLSSCKTREKIIKTDAIRNVDMEALKNTLENRNERIKTLRFSKIKFDLKLNEAEYKTGGTIGLIKDSIIVISVVPIMGYEMARIYCTRDSLLLINRTDKSFYKSGLQDELRKYNLSVDYEMLQSILMNDYFVYSERTKDRFHENSLVLKDGEYLIKSEEKINNELYFTQEQIIDATHFGIKSVGINDYAKKEMLSIKYDLFNDYLDVYLPGIIILNSLIRNYSVSVEMNIGEIEVNEIINADVRIPSKYKRLTL